MCEKPLRHVPEMNAIFESMFMHPQMDAGSLKLSVYVHKVGELNLYGLTHQHSTDL